MKQSPMYKEPTEKQRMRITAARKRMREGMEGEKDLISRISTTSAKAARDEQKMAMRDMEKVPESVRRYEMEEGQTATPFKKGGSVSKSLLYKYKGDQSVSDIMSPKGGASTKSTPRETTDTMDRSIKGQNFDDMLKEPSREGGDFKGKLLAKGGMVNKSKKKSSGNVMRGCGAAVKGKSFKGVF